MENQQPGAMPVMPKKRSTRTKKKGMPWRLLLISLVVFGLSVVVWAGMEFGYVPYLESQINTLDGDLVGLSQSISDEQQAAFTAFYSQLYNISALANTHKYPSAFFDFLEENTYSSILLEGARADIKTGEAQIEGVAPQFSTLTDQLAMYKSQSGVVNVLLDTSRARDIQEGGGVAFGMKILFEKSYFEAK